MITNDGFVDFLHCNRKAYLRAVGTVGHPTDIETVLLDLGKAYRRQALEAFLSRTHRMFCVTLHTWRGAEEHKAGHRQRNCVGRWVVFRDPGRSADERDGPA